MGKSLIRKDNMNWSGRKVFITGADGFIGSHLTEAVAALGAEVTALAQYNSFDRYGWLDDIAPTVRDSLNLVRGDIRDHDQMRDLCKGQNVVLHLAALIAIPYSYSAPSSYVQTNVQGTLNILQAARDGGVERIIHTSTSEVYGTAQVTPITEDHPLQGQSPYSASKIGADMMAEAFYRSFGLPVITLRPFNTFGPRQSERAVISTVIRQVIDPECDSIRIGDLSPKRDFNYVMDTADAFIKAAGLDDSHLGRTFNVGSGHMVRIGEMIEIVRSISGTDKQVLFEKQRTRPAGSEVMALMADSARFQAASGWKPHHTLEEGLAQTIQWWRGHMDRARIDTDYAT